MAILYDIRDVRHGYVNHSHLNKLRILRMTMENYEYKNSFESHTTQGKLFLANLHKVNELISEGRETLTKEEMLYMNLLFKTYDGKIKDHT